MITRDELLNDNEEALRIVLDGRQSGIWTAFPAIVTKVDLSSMTCEVQPVIQGIVTSDKGVDSYVNMPVLVDCPIVFPSAGGFTITFPLAVNDEVLVVIASRCVDAWWQQGGVQPPMEARMHDLSDGFVIPGPKSQPKKISGISSTNLQIRNNEGAAFVEITNSGAVNILAGAKVGVGNGGTSLGGALADLCSALEGFLTGLNSGTLTGAASTALPLVQAAATELSGLLS